jgi:molybdopterin-guanine dinucleotide biosynthesis protein A
MKRPESMSPQPLRVLGLVLAGGQGRRLGGVNKAFEVVAGRTCLDHVSARLGPQVDDLALNANDEDPRWPEETIIRDFDPDARQGPLAGLIAGLRHAATRGFDAIVSLPVDMPFAPRDLVQRLTDRYVTENAGFGLAACDDQLCPVAGLWPAAALPTLESAFDTGLRAPRALAHLMPMAVARWPSTPFDPFTSLNRPEDRARLEEIALLAD